MNQIKPAKIGRNGTKTIRKNKKMRVIAVQDLNLTEDKIIRYMVRKLEWIEKRKVLYIERSDRRFLDGMECVIYDLAKNVLRKELKDDTRKCN